MHPTTLLAALAGCGLVGHAVGVNRRRAQAPALPAAVSAGATGGTPPVTVVLPVRDEEANLEPCLDSLLAQTLQPQILVVDDGSTDRTLALARRRAAVEPRLELIEAGPLPPGWGGKVHALAVGHRHLRDRAGGPPRWLLSTDADTRHRPDLLARALAAADRHRLDLVSLAGHQEVSGAGENLLTPPVFALLDAQLGDWRRAALGGGPPTANGQLILVREATLAAAGGFDALAGVAIDDVGLAVLIRSVGGATGFWRAPELLSVRMYRGAGRTVAGWRRNLGGLFGPDPRRAVAAAAVGLAPAAAALVALAARRPTTAALAWSAGAVTSALLRRGSGHRAAWGLSYPADAVALTATLLAGIGDWRRGRLSAWKGRPVPVATEPPSS